MGVPEITTTRGYYSKYRGFSLTAELVEGELAKFTIASGEDTTTFFREESLDTLEVLLHQLRQVLNEGVEETEEITEKVYFSERDGVLSLWASLEGEECTEILISKKAGIMHQYGGAEPQSLFDLLASLQDRLREIQKEEQP